MTRPVNRSRGGMADDGVTWIAGIPWFSNTGAPVDGTSGTGAGVASVGAVYVRTSNGRHYHNENTKASPTWVIVPNA